MVPATLLIIFLLLYLSFRCITENPHRHALAAVLVCRRAVADALDGIQLQRCSDRWLHRLGRCRRETGVIMLIYLDHALNVIRAKNTQEGRALTLADLNHAIMDGGGGARAAQDDDGRRYHGRIAAGPVEQGSRLRAYAAHRGTDDWRHGVIDVANGDRDPGDLCLDQGKGSAAYKTVGRVR